MSQLSNWMKNSGVISSGIRSLLRPSAITLASYGSATSTRIAGTLFKLEVAQRVTLSAIDHEDGSRLSDSYSLGGGGRYHFRFHLQTRKYLPSIVLQTHKDTWERIKDFVQTIMQML